jgi:glycine/D-amino acid oxidase-like deaminating enzyme
MGTRELGFWWHSIGGPPPPRAPLEGPLEADVAIVGAGFTGLWSAYYLKRARPSLEIVMLEREFAGFGASGRNGGWVSGFFSGPARAYVRDGHAEGYAALQRAMFNTVEELAAVVSEHAIDADFLKAGQLTVALNDAQLEHVREQVAAARELGLGEGDLHELSAGQLEERVRVAGARGASYTPHVARVHPAKLVRGLAEAVQRLGVRIHEGTEVQRIERGAAITRAGAVRARWIVRATEGYTPSLPGVERLLAPVNSSMVITEPLPADTWAQIGWGGQELLDDGAHVYVYAQRTADGRIALGGRGVPYRYASRTAAHGTSPATVASLNAKLQAMFPAAAGVPLEAAWSGVLGVPRDWAVSVDVDRNSGLAWAGGYVGLGVCASNLAGRMLRDAILGEPGALTALPWFGRRPRSWEPEPLRWAGIRGVYALYRLADARERRRGRPWRLARLVDRLSGRV